MLVDANLLVSVLLSSDPARSAAAAVLAGARAGSFSLVVAVETLEEAARIVGSKPWLMARISPDDVEALISDIETVAEIAPRLDRLPPRISRDPGDDYLLAQAVLAEVDLLVTRDGDLLDLGEFAGVHVLDPVAFLDLLRSRRD